MERLLHCSQLLQRRGGERHENLSVDAADRHAFDRDSLHFSARTGLQTASMIAALPKA
jgi:hypothetical protein